MENVEREFFINGWLDEPRKLLSFISRLKLSIRQRIAFSFLIIIFLMATLNVVFGLQTVRFQHSYDIIIENITAGNELSGYVSSEINEEMWKVITGYAAFEDGQQYTILDNVRAQIEAMMLNAGSRRGELKLDVILRTIRSLEGSIDEMGTLAQSDANTADLQKQLEDIMWIAGLIETNIQDYMVFEIFQSEQQYFAIKNNFRQLIIVNGIVLVAVLVFSGGATWVISESIYVPIKKLHDVTREITDQDLDILLRGEHRDEITQVGITFNLMIQRINDLLASKVKEQENLKKAELRTLQAQITPHFLYNTFDTIIWLAEARQTDRVIDIVKALSDFFRIGLSKGEDWITLREEIQHTRSYLTIQQMRYCDILDYEIDVDESLLDCAMLKLTLQPLVENALYHGIKQSRRGGKITVRGQRVDEYTMKLSVADNGMGFTPERLASIQAEIDNPPQKIVLKESGFGLTNVNRRVRLYYGEAYHLNIQSTYQYGTTVAFTIPLTIKQ